MKSHIPNAITACNAFSGLIGITFVLNGKPDYAIYFVLIAGIFDFFDGFAARLLNTTSAIGKELDSLADAISFGALPTFYVFVLADSVDNSYLIYGTLLIGVFSLLRLAKFNIDTEQEDKFIGLPTPANAIMLTSFSLQTYFQVPTIWVIMLVSIVSSFLLVSPMEMIALKFKNLSFKENQWRFLTLAVSVALVTIMQIPGIFFVIPAYITLSVLMNLFRSTNS